MLTIGTFHLPSVLLSFFSWSSLYFGLCRLQPQRKAEWHCRTVTAVHAALISAITAWACFVQGPWPFTDAGGPNTRLQVIAATTCLGYFFFDFAWCLYFQTEGPPMLLHHMLSILGMTWTLCSGKYGTELMATVCGSEITNPLLQLRWFLKETGRYHTMLGEIVDATFMLSFFFLRIVMGSVLLYCYFQQPTDFWGRLGATCIYLIGWMFWVSIFRYAIYKYTKRYRHWCSTKQSRAAEGKAALISSADGSTEDDIDNDESSKNRQEHVKSSASSPAMQETSSSSSCRSTVSKESNTDVSKNGLHHRSNGIHAKLKGSEDEDELVTDSDVYNDVLAYSKVHSL